MTEQQPPIHETVPVPRWWLEHTRKCLQGDLPSGRIGDAVFLLRDIIGDMLETKGASTINKGDEDV